MAARGLLRSATNTAPIQHLDAPTVAAIEQIVRDLGLVA